MARVERERAAALGERQREERRSRDQGTTRHMTPGNERGAPGPARPKGSGFNRACEPASHAERHLDRHVRPDRKSTRLNSSHLVISYAVFCLKKKKKKNEVSKVMFV